jgi:hypothetical protein
MTLRNDATRLRIVTQEKRRPRAVVARQGQVLLDTDFAEQSRHQLERIEIETQDSLGRPGRLIVPAGDHGFEVTPDGAVTNFDIGAGHGYLGGWLVENLATCKLATQPHPRSGDAVGLPLVAALKVLVRHIDPQEEPVLTDKALGDAQASGRSLVDWQVFPFPVTAGGTVSCETLPSFAEWQALIAPSTGTLAVAVKTAAPSTDPCSLTPGGGYSRLDNLLYRIEVHDGTAAAGAPQIDGPRFGLHGLKLKLSRRNASVMVRIANIAGAEITVDPPALDYRNWFAPGLFAEIVSLHDDVDPSAALKNERLFRVAKASDDRVVLEATPQQIADTQAVADNRWFLRLWDAWPTGNGTETVSAPGGASSSAPVEVGDGLSATLGDGLFRRGDYWTCAARADGSVDWPVSGGGAERMTPHGPEIRYAPLAVLSGAANAPEVEDCRIPFATLTDRALLYRGGDGQTASAALGSGMAPLQAKLRVAVMRGETPVAGAAIRWSFLEPAGGSCLVNGVVCDGANTPETPTDANGLAEVTWAIDSNAQLVLHQIQAQLVEGTAPGSPAVVFSARFEAARSTTYFPGSCQHLAGVDNVQDALDALCQKIGEPKDQRTLSLVAIAMHGAQGTIDLIPDEFMRNAIELPHTSFLRGIFFGFDLGMPTIKIRPFDPVVEVVLDLPYPITDPDRLYWAEASDQTVQGHFGFQQVRLDGTVQLVAPDGGLPGGLLWLPSNQAERFLRHALAHLFGHRITRRFIGLLNETGWSSPENFERVLCRLRLRSSMIWVGEGRERVYLNAEHLGIVGPDTSRELSLKDLDAQRAADLDMFVYLTPQG